MSEPYERTFVGRVQRVTRSLDEDSDKMAEIVVEGYEHWLHHFFVCGDGSEWTPGQRVDVILRAVHEVEAPKTEDSPDAD